MTLKEAAWQRRVDIETMPDNPYPLANVYGNTAPRRRSINYTAWTVTTLAAIYALLVFWGLKG